MSVIGGTQRETRSYTKSEGENNGPVREGLRLAYTFDILCTYDSTKQLTLGVSFGLSRNFDVR